MQRKDLYVRKNSYFNLTSGMTGEKMNLPMYNKDIKLFKGIENRIQFSIRDHDRKAYPLRDRTIMLAIINPKNGEKILKEMWQIDAYKGIYEVVFSDKEMKDFDTITYKAYTYSIDLNGEEDLLYAGTDWNPEIFVNVSDSISYEYEESKVLNPNEFLHNFYIDKVDGQRYDYYVSSVIDATNTEYHSASITVKDGFLGKITMEGSMDVDPEHNESDWFIIDEKEYDDDTKKDAETFQFNKQLNCLWIRFKYTVKSANTGSVEEILYRN